MITETASNERFRNVVKSLHWQFARARGLAGFIPNRHNKSLREHVKIAEQILAGNAAGAEKAMARHLHSTMVDLVAPDNVYIFSLANRR